MRYAFVAKHRTCYPVSIMCRVLEVSSAGFYGYLTRCATPPPDPDAALRESVRSVHQQSRRTYGRPRIVRALRDLGHTIGPKRVQRLMREAGLRGVCKGRFTPRLKVRIPDRSPITYLSDALRWMRQSTYGLVTSPTYRPRKAGCT